jgi:hypothetical protein
MRTTTRTRCDVCNSMCLPHEIASVPDEDRRLCYDCAPREGWKIDRAADGSFTLTRRAALGNFGMAN